MKRFLVDVNVWVALLYEGHVHHGRADRWFETLQEETAVCCRMTQVGLLRALTNSSIMGSDVCSMRAAWDSYRQVQEDERFLFLDEPHDIETSFRKLSFLPFPAPKLWTDAYLEAFANAAGIGLATFDGGSSTRGGVRDLVIIE